MIGSSYLVTVLYRWLANPVSGLFHLYGDGSIPIITIFGGITIYSPAILEYLGYQGFDP